MFLVETAHAVIDEKDGDRRVGALVTEVMGKATVPKTAAEAGAWEDAVIMLIRMRSSFPMVRRRNTSRLASNGIVPTSLDEASTLKIGFVLVKE